MQKQKTLAKWLAIILLSSIAVGSYVLYDALYLKKQDNEASADIGKDNQPIEKTEDETYIPYYTTLPRKAETIDNFKVTHFGGEDDDTLIDVINFGKNAGRTLKDIAENDPGFLRWIIKNDFPEEVKEIASNALIGKFPEKAASSQNAN